MPAVDFASGCFPGHVRLIDRDLEQWAFVFLLSFLKQLLIICSEQTTGLEDWPSAGVVLL